MARYLFWLALLMPMCASADMLRDPTVPLSYVPADTSSSSNTSSQGNMTLGAIYISNNSYAVINGKVVRVGDDVSGYTVSKITRGYVELDGKTEKLKLTMYKNSVVAK